MKDIFLSIVIPAYNEEQGIQHAVTEVAEIARQCTHRHEIIVIDDGSKDQTYENMCSLCLADNSVKVVKFSRNFGKEATLLAGLELATGDVVVTMDADLQHPPSLIPVLLQEWEKGYKVVHAVKSDRLTDSFATRLRAQVFNGLLKRLGGIEAANASDFKLLDRVAVDVLVQALSERGRFYRGLADWIGFKQAWVPFSVANRNAGVGKWSAFSLIGLAVTAIVSFTSAPLRIVTILGFCTLLFAFVVAVETLWSWFMGQSVSGFATIIITVLILGSFNMISLGIMGEYIAKIYGEIKARPMYIVESSHGIEGAESNNKRQERL